MTRPDRAGYGGRISPATGDGVGENFAEALLASLVDLQNSSAKAQLHPARRRRGSRRAGHAMQEAGLMLLKSIEVTGPASIEAGQIAASRSGGLSTKNSEDEASDALTSRRCNTCISAPRWAEMQRSKTMAATALARACSSRLNKEDPTGGDKCRDRNRGQPPSDARARFFRAASGWTQRQYLTQDRAMPRSGTTISARTTSSRPLSRPPKPASISRRACDPAVDYFSCATAGKAGIPSGSMPRDDPIVVASHHARPR